MNTIISTPVLLIAFNRPDTTEEVFQKIRDVQPKKLYVAVDGPRKNKENEIKQVETVKQIVQKVDWECDTKYLYRKSNLGCKIGVSGAISWALENEERVIVIEDDIIAETSFFSFAENLLERYKDDERVAMISANNYTPLETIDSDYLFTKYGHIWGWATWKRVWDKFDLELPYLKDDIENGVLKTIGLSKSESYYYQDRAKKLLNAITSETINTWDTQFGYFRLRNKLLSIAPSVNLASNIGTTSSRTDYVAETNENYYPAYKNFILSEHPPMIECNPDYEKLHFKMHINQKSFFAKVVYKLKLFKVSAIKSLKRPIIIGLSSVNYLFQNVPKLL